MIDLRRKFLILCGTVYYIEDMKELVVQRGLLDESFGPLGNLQPGLLSRVTLKTPLPFVGKLDFPVQIYLLNSALQLNMPTVKYRLEDGNTYSISSEYTDILFENKRKLPTVRILESYFKTLIIENNTDNDEKN